MFFAGYITSKGRYTDEMWNIEGNWNMKALALILK